MNQIVSIGVDDIFTRENYKKHSRQYHAVCQQEKTTPSNPDR